MVRRKMAVIWLEIIDHVLWIVLVSNNVWWWSCHKPIVKTTSRSSVCQVRGELSQMPSNDHLVRPYVKIKASYFIICRCNQVNVCFNCYNIWWNNISPSYLTGGLLCLCSVQTLLDILRLRPTGDNTPPTGGDRRHSSRPLLIWFIV